MSKQCWKPSTMLNPVPLVMVSCSRGDSKPNIITLAWTGTINSEPPMLSISVRKDRYSYDIIKESGQFVVNLVNGKLAKAADFCGVKSGKDVDKFSHLGLTPAKAFNVAAPVIEESPVNIECEVKQIIELGSHDMFVSKVLSVDIDESLLDNSGKLRLDKAGLVCYCHGAYFGLGQSLGYFGYSVTKRKDVILRRKGT